MQRGESFLLMLRENLSDSKILIMSVKNFRHYCSELDLAFLFKVCAFIYYIWQRILKSYFSKMSSG